MRLPFFLAAMLIVACPAPPTGTRCTQHTDCRGIPEAYCSRAEVCSRVCDVAACPEGYRCASEGARRVCLAACDGEGPCLEGFACGPSAEGGVCRLTAPLARLPAR
jgi:hypothetical protein